MAKLKRLIEYYGTEGNHRFLNSGVRGFVRRNLKGEEEFNPEEEEDSANFNFHVRNILT